MSTDPTTDETATSPEGDAVAHEASEVEDGPVAAPTPMEGLPLRGQGTPRPSIERAPRDPMAAARAALSQAAEARGAQYTPPPPGRRHPLEAAQEALAKAQAARDHASKGGTAGLAREADAWAQLQALRSGGYTPPSRGPSEGDDGGSPQGAPPASAPKKRTL